MSFSKLLKRLLKKVSSLSDKAIALRQEPYMPENDDQVEPIPSYETT